MGKSYETYKDSGVEWIGEIPKHWQMGKIKYFTADVPYPIVDGPFGTQLKASEYQESGVPLVRISNLDFNGNLSLENIKYISESKAEEIKRSSIVLNDLIIGKTGATIGKSGLNTNIEHGVISSSCLKISIDQNQIRPTFLKYFVISDNFQEIVLQTASGSTRDTINITPMANLELVVPSLQEQTQIAFYLDYYTQLIDDLIAKKETLIQKLQEQRQAIINEAVTKGLNKDVKLKDSGIEWLGEIPEHWEVVRLFGLCEFVRGNSSFKKDELLSNGEYVALQYGKTYKVNIIDEDYKFYVNEEFYKDSQIVNEGDVIIISTSETIEDLGHSVYYDRSHLGLLGGEQIVLKSKKEKINSKYLFYSSKVFLKSLRKYATGVKVFRFNINDLKNTHIAIPSLAEQELIVKQIESKSIISKKVMLDTQSSIQKLKEYRQSLISEAVTGKIDVRDWRPPNK